MLGVEPFLLGDEGTHVLDVEEAKAEIRTEHPQVSADHPTRSYARLHRRERSLNELIHKRSKGKYGQTYATEYEPGGGKWGFGGPGPSSDTEPLWGFGGSAPAADATAPLWGPGSPGAKKKRTRRKKPYGF